MGRRVAGSAVGFQARQTDKRGSILKKTGERRRYRYRFINPLMQPFIIIYGISTGLLSEDFVRNVSWLIVSRRTISER
jgi:hypothetical protein